MGIDQKGSTAFHISTGENGQWNVFEQGFEKPLASFQSESDAKAYAEHLAQTKGGSLVSRHA
jgi:hypothetical protein